MVEVLVVDMVGRVAFSLVDGGLFDESCLSSSRVSQDTGYFDDIEVIIARKI